LDCVHEVTEFTITLLKIGPMQLPHRAILFDVTKHSEFAIEGLDTLLKYGAAIK